MEKEEAEDVTDEDERSLNFITHLFTNYFVPLFKGANAKPSSLEHLTNLPQKACYQLTANLRTKTVEAVYVTWCSLGKPASVQDRFRFGLDRFGGFQRLLYSDESYGVIKQILLCGMQRNSQCQELCSKMFWSVIVSEWVQWRSLYELERVSISALYEIFFNKYTYSPETEEINTLIANLERLANVLDLEDEAHDPILKFIGTIFDFLTTAAEMKGFPESAEFDNDRVFYKLQLLLR
ncbi:unnamed protein product [Ambrosiozyma monospora]|uniref:Unnamed protein product n=1 Tax=Ambrosiozyma monospora TaxID=43982 RepID=A0ACB5U3Q6_AMBMO|nr:unnamed protein product [Ambrosiozyma monospora]